MTTTQERNRRRQHHSNERQTTSHHSVPSSVLPSSLPPFLPSSVLPSSVLPRSVIYISVNRIGDDATSDSHLPRAAEGAIEHLVRLVIVDEAIGGRIPLQFTAQPQGNIGDIAQRAGSLSLFDR